jgi:serine/threonine-protein kinase
LHAAFDLGDEDETRTAAPRTRNVSNLQTRAATAARAQAQPADVEELDPDSQAELADLAGEILDGRYRVERLLGTGGMGAVYEAEHIEIGKKVALKVLHPQYSRQADLVARFRREARAASKVGHPNIVDVTDSGTTERGDVYFVMERLDGLDLGEVLRHERRIAPDRTVHIGTQICRALSAAHSAGIIHRDLKPENVFLVSRDGNADFVKVLDFGIAKQDMGNQNHPRRLTTPGIAMGTPEYMAPEQAAGKAIDGRVDIYSVGAILYEMLTGEPPHAGANVMEIMAKKATEAPRPLRDLNPQVPEALEQAVLLCLEKNPDARPQTMGALEYELNKSTKGRGSAVAAVLGLKQPSDEMFSSGPEESSYRRLFDPPRSKTSPGILTPVNAIAPGPSGPSGVTGALPLTATDDKVRVKSRRVSSPDALGATVAETAMAPKKPEARWPWVLLVLAVLGGGGFAAVHYLAIGKVIDQPHLAVAPPPPPAPEPEQPKPAPTAAKEPKGEDDKMSPEAIESMLEWARRASEGGRIISPPKDNVKELLDRIEKADPGNAGAEALRKNVVATLGRKSLLALKKGRIDEAVQDYEALAAFKPDDAKIKHMYARTLRMRAERDVGQRKLQAALNDVTASLELEPDDNAARLVLADTYLGLGKHELAAEEYQRILDGKPADKRAARGLQIALAAKNKPQPKKKKGR